MEDTPFPVNKSAWALAEEQGSPQPAQDPTICTYAAGVFEPHLLHVQGTSLAAPSSWRKRIHMGI